MIVQDLITQLENSPLINAIVPANRITFKRPLNSDEFINNDNLIYVERKIEVHEDACVESNIFQIIAYSKTALELESICEAIKQTFKNGNNLLDNNYYFRNKFLSRTDGVNKLTTGFYWSTMTYDFSQIVG